jgi:hypothetical protein
MGDRPSLIVQDLLDTIDIALRIDHDRVVAAADDITPVTEVRGVDGYDVDFVHGATFRD